MKKQQKFRKQKIQQQTMFVSKKSQNINAAYQDSFFISANSQNEYQVQKAFNTNNKHDTHTLLFRQIANTNVSEKQKNKFSHQSNGKQSHQDVCEIFEIQLEQHQQEKLVNVHDQPNQNSKGDCTDRDDLLKQKLIHLFQIVEMLLFKGLSSNTKQVSFDYQQVYESVWQLINEDKEDVIEQYESQRFYGSYQELIVGVVINEMVNSRLLGYVQQWINDNLGDQVSLNSQLDEQSQGIKPQVQYDFIYNRQTISRNMNKLTNMIIQIQHNIKTISSLLLCIQTDIDSNPTLSYKYSKQYSYQNHYTSQLHKNKDKTQPFSIQLKIRQIVFYSLINQGYMIKLMGNGLKVVLVGFMGKYEEEECVGVRQVKKTLIDLVAALGSFCIVRDECQIVTLSLFLLFNRLMNEKFMRDLIAVFSHQVESIFSSYKYQLLSQKQTKIHENFNKSNVCILNFFKQILITAKKNFRQVFLQPQQALYFPSLIKYIQKDYLKERTKIKKLINQFLQNILTKILFTENNFNVLFPLNVSKQENQMRFFKEQSSQKQQKHQFKYSDQWETVKVLMKMLIVEDIGSASTLLLFQNYQLDLDCQNDIVRSNSILKQNSRNKDSTQLSFFNGFFQISALFIEKLNTFLINQLSNRFRNKFQQPIDIKNIQSITKSNKLLQQFHTFYCFVRKLTISNSNSISGILGQIVKINISSMSKLLNNFQDVIQCPESSFAYRLVLFGFSVNLSKPSNQKSQKSVQNIIFKDIFRICCKNSGFLSQFQHLLHQFNIMKFMYSFRDDYLYCPLRVVNNKQNIIQQQLLIFGCQNNCSLINSQMLDYIKKQQGSQFVRRNQQIYEAEKKSHQLSSSILQNEQNQSKPIHLSGNQKVVVTKANQSRTNLYRQSQALKQIQNTQNKILSRINVLILNYHQYFRKQQTLAFQQFGNRSIFFVNTQRNREKLDYQIPVITQERGIWIQNLDQLLLKYIGLYEDKLKRFENRKGTFSNHKTLHWLISSQIDSAITMQIKIPVSKQTNIMNNSSVLICGTKQSYSTLSKSQLLMSETPCFSRKGFDKPDPFKVTVRMPLLMADIFLYAFRKRVENVHRFSFTIKDYLKHIDVEKSIINERHQQFLRQKVLNLTEKLIEAGFIEKISSEMEQQSMQLTEEMELKLNELLIYYSFVNKESHAGQLLSFFFVDKQNSHKVQFQSHNKTPILDFITLPASLNTKKSFISSLQSNSKVNEQNCGQIDFAQYLTNPPLQFLLILECQMIKLFKKQKKIHSSEVLPNLVKFLSATEQTGKKYSKMILLLIEISKEIKSQANQTKEARINRQFSDIVQKITQKLVKKQYIEQKYYPLAENVSSQKNNVQIYSEDKTQIESQMFYQYLP